MESVKSIVKDVVYGKSKIHTNMEFTFSNNMLSFNKIKGLHVVTVAWYNPSGELYKFAENDFGSYEEADDDKVMVRFWLNLAGIDEADFGNWTVRAFLDGEMIKEDNIVISKNGTGKIDELC